MASTMIDRVDGLSSSTAIKGPVRAATTANVSLYSLQTIDGVALADGDRVLVKDQTAAYENGVYVVDTGQWRRVKDFNKTRDVLKGTLVYVSDGTINGSTTWKVTSSTNDVGTSNITFSKLTGSAAGLDVGTIAGTVAAGNDARILQAAALPSYTASEKGQAVVVSEDGLGLELGGALTGEFFAEDGARIIRQADRVFIGDAIDNAGTNTGSQADWLTQKLIGYGRTFAFQQVTQQAVLTTDNDYSANASLAGARTSTLGIPGNAIGVLGVGINDNTTLQTGAYGGYFEGFQEAGTLGPAYGVEVDIINFGSDIAIDPFTQNDRQTVGQQMASGAEFVGAGSASAAYNIRNNGANFLRGIVVGHDAIAGTDGSSGRGPWVQIVTGHSVQHFSSAGVMAWEEYAEPGLNGDYIIDSQGTGSVEVKRFRETTGDVWDSYTPTATPTSGSFTTISTSGRYRVRGKSVDFSAQLSITTNGTATGGINISLPFQAAAGIGYALAADERSASGVVCRASVTSNGTTAQVFRYDNTYAGGTGATIVVSGVYQKV